MSGIPMRAEADLAVLATPGLRWRRWLFFGLVLLTTALAVAGLLFLLWPGGLSVRIILSVTLFGLLFAWISQSFWTAFFGLCLRLLRRDPLSLRPLPELESTPVSLQEHGGTALVMPVFNEDPERALRGLEACCRSIEKTGQAAHFSVFLLSDSTRPEIAAREARAVEELRQRLPAGMALHYRRRAHNTGRKAGNLADFCRLWGNRFRYMVVLDADSLMQGETVVSLVALMERNPRAGLIQTVPMPVRSRTLFARLMQFAATLYGPLLAVGSSFWQGSDANYWGHNAIIRLQPFHAHCQLPVLPGQPPLGGEILSHDFVEAALLKRAGWDVWFLSDLPGSYEELPGTIFAYARRDRRWTQGNMQHLKLLREPGLHPINRLHFVMGAASFLVSLVWLGLLLSSWFDPTLIAQAGAALAMAPDAASQHAAQQRYTVAMLLFGSTLLLLFGPRLMGILHALRGPQSLGRRLRLLLSALLETLAAVLMAPLMMLFHCWFLLGIACGRAIGWDPQVRDAGIVPWREVLRATALPAMLGLLGLATLPGMPPIAMAWLVPVCLGLALSPWLVRWTSSAALGERMRRLGLFQAPPTAATHSVLHELAQLEARDHGRHPAAHHE